MARSLKFIKVKMTRSLSGQNEYPPFNEIPPFARGDRDWSYYIDDTGTGWQYDEIDGFGEGSDPDSMYGMIGVPADFADEALTRWPTLVTQMTESEVEAFWNDHAHITEPATKESPEILSAIASKKQLGIRLSPQDRGALNPDDPTHGVRKNHMKTWQRYKTKFDVIVDES